MTHVKLKDSSWSEKLVEQLERLRQANRFCDVVISTSNGDTLVAHAVILVASSPFISARLEKNALLLEVAGIETQTWKQLIRYMYQGKVNVRESQLPALEKAAEKLQMEKLLDIIKTHSKGNKDSDKKAKICKKEVLKVEEKSSKHSSKTGVSTRGTANHTRKSRFNVVRDLMLARRSTPFPPPNATRKLGVRLAAKKYEIKRQEQKKQQMKRQEIKKQELKKQEVKKQDLKKQEVKKTIEKKQITSKKTPSKQTPNKIQSSSRPERKREKDTPLAKTVDKKEEKIGKSTPKKGAQQKKPSSIPQEDSKKKKNKYEKKTKKKEQELKDWRNCPIVQVKNCVVQLQTSSIEMEAGLTPCFVDLSPRPEKKRQKVFYCEPCKKHLSNYPSLMRHYDRNHRFNCCGFCGKGFASKELLTRHWSVEVTHRNADLKGFKVVTDGEIHRLAIQGKNPQWSGRFTEMQFPSVRCSRCDEESCDCRPWRPASLSLEEVQITASPSQSRSTVYCCNQCTETFTSNEDLLIHFTSHGLPKKRPAPTDDASNQVRRKRRRPEDKGAVIDTIDLTDNKEMESEKEVICSDDDNDEDEVKSTVNVSEFVDQLLEACGLSEHDDQSVKETQSAGSQSPAESNDGNQSAGENNVETQSMRDQDENSIPVEDQKDEAEDMIEISEDEGGNEESEARVDKEGKDCMEKDKSDERNQNENAENVIECNDGEKDHNKSSGEQNEEEVVCIDETESDKLKSIQAQIEEDIVCLDDSKSDKNETIEDENVGDTVFNDENESEKDACTTEQASDKLLDKVCNNAEQGDGKDENKVQKGESSKGKDANVTQKGDDMEKIESEEETPCNERECRGEGDEKTEKTNNECNKEQAMDTEEQSETADTEKEMEKDTVDQSKKAENLNSGSNKDCNGQDYENNEKSKSQKSTELNLDSKVAKVIESVMDGKDTDVDVSEILQQNRQVIEADVHTNLLGDGKAAKSVPATENIAKHSTEAVLQGCSDGSILCVIPENSK